MKKNQKFIIGNQDVDTSFVSLEMIWAGMRDPRLKDQIGISQPDTFFEIIKGRTINCLIDAKKIKPFISKCAESLLSDKKLLSLLKKKTFSIAGKIQNLARENISKLDSLSPKEISDLLIQIRVLQAECVVFGIVVAYSDIFGGITNAMLEIVNKRKNLKFPVSLCTHVFGSPLNKSLTEEAYADIRMGKKSREELLQEYFWLNQGYVGRGLTERELGEIQSHRDESSDSISFKQITKELALTKEELRVFEVSRDIIEIKSTRIDSRQFLYVLLNRLVDILAREWKTESRLIETMSTEEIYAVLMDKNNMPKDLENRWQHTVVFPKAEGYEYLSGADAYQFLQEHFLKEEIENQVSITGRVAYGGKITGVAKLVFGPQHINKVKEGDILVSFATSPQLLPAMKIAGAFVTDVGGITSHAAIVAREFKKPCVVGTRNATQIFKDGDIVEVDAEKGIVKLLNK